MRERGYELSGLGERPSPQLVVAYGYRHARSAARDFRIDVQEALRRHRYRAPLAAVPAATGR